MSHTETTEKMQQALGRMAIPLTVVWTPDPSKAVHGKLEGDLLLIYDQSEDEAWQTFIHECCEHRFQQVLTPYRAAINALIDVIEKTCYQRKEEFLEFLPALFDAIGEAKQPK